MWCAHLEMFWSTVWYISNDQNKNINFTLTVGQHQFFFFFWRRSDRLKRDLGIFNDFYNRGQILHGTASMCSLFSVSDPVSSDLAN